MWKLLHVLIFRWAETVYFHASGMSCSNSMCLFLLMFINQKVNSRSTCRNKTAWGNWGGQGSVSQDLQSRSLGTNCNFVGSDTVLCKTKKSCFRKVIKWNWSPCAMNHPSQNPSSNYWRYLVYCKLSSNFVLALGEHAFCPILFKVSLVFKLYYHD